MFHLLIYFMSQGRTYDGHILDMIEFGVDPESFRSMAEFTTPKKAIGSKPLFIFQGSQWESDTLYGRVQNLLLDMFRGVKLDMLSLQGIDHAFVATVEDGKIYLRVYSVSFRKSGTKVPTVHLELSGPAIDLTVRRHQLGGDDMWKAACKQPKA